MTHGRADRDRRTSHRSHGRPWRSGCCGWGDAGNGSDKHLNPNRLYRSGRNRYLTGVCGGIAEYLGVEGWLVRVFAVIALMMFPPPTLIGYIIVSLVLPRAPDDLYRDAGEQEFWRDVRVDPSRKFSELRHRFRELERRLQRTEAYVTSKSFRLNRDINKL
ncbi:MAG: envelope stress response membrane protein PspC [Hyphomicrobiales bacterium]|nr:envelope stress response membrane protein PspC [Hyphomicrobiales bacterium]